MGKKEKTKKNKAKKSDTSRGSKFEEKYAALEKDIRNTRAKMQKLLAKNAQMDVQDYAFKNKAGGETKLSEMFGDKKELIVIHNMGKSCSYCTLWADGFNGVTYFIEKKAAFVVISPDSFEVQRDFAAQRGWKFNMYSGKESSFIKDMGYLTDAGSYWPGASVFNKDSSGKITRISKTYFGPGDDYCSVWHFFDMLPAAEEGK